MALAEAGRDIGVHYRGDRPGADETIGRVERAGRRGTGLYADLDIESATDLDRACEDLLDRCAGVVGALDVVVLNAFPQDLVPWAELDTNAWDRMHRAGLRPTTALLQRALARLGPGGVVVVVGSIEGLRPAPMHAPYAVAKAALHHHCRGRPRGRRTRHPGGRRRTGAGRAHRTARGVALGSGSLGGSQRPRPSRDRGGSCRNGGVPRLTSRIGHHRHHDHHRRRVVRRPGLVILASAGG